MRKTTLLIVLSLAAFSCGRVSAPPNIVVVEEDSPILGPDGKLKEALGIETIGALFTPLIEAGVEAPCEKSQVFSTTSDNQDQIKIHLFRGNQAMARDNHSLGIFQITNIPPAQRHAPQIQVTFRVTEDRIVASATDLNANIPMTITRVE